MTAPARQGDKGLFLRASRDIEFVKRHGRRSSTAFFNLLVCRTNADGTRVGIVVGRRFGTAVSRNRVKRRFRELIRSVRGRLYAGYALVVFPKRDALTLPYGSIRDVWSTTLARQGVCRGGEG